MTSSCHVGKFFKNNFFPVKAAFLKTKLSRYTLYDGLQMQKIGLSYIWLDYNSGIKDMEINMYFKFS